MKHKILMGIYLQQGVITLAGICVFLIPYAALWFLVRGSYNIGAISFQHLGFGFSDIISPDFYKNPLLLFMVCLMFCVFFSTQFADLVGSVSNYFLKKSLTKLFGEPLIARYELIKIAKKID